MGNIKGAELLCGFHSNSAGGVHEYSYHTQALDIWKLSQLS